jgi:nucleoside-diphosphate-sugar epimerase
LTLVHLNPAPQAPSRVVVVGASGFVGGAVASALRARGVPVLAVGRGEVDLLAADAGERLAALLRADDAVVAAAAIAPVKNVAMFEANAQLVRRLVEALERRPVAYLLNIGSDAMLGDTGGPLVEGTTVAPDSLHGAMHLFREIALRGLAATPMGSLRPTLIYGAHDPHNGYGPNRFRRLAQAGEPIVLFGEGEERRDHVLVDDVAELAVRMVMRRSVGALNAATGHVTSFRDIATKVAALAGARSPVRSSPRNGPMPHGGYRPFDPAAVFSAFPDFRFTPIDAGLARVHAETAKG